LKKDSAEYKNTTTAAQRKRIKSKPSQNQTPLRNMAPHLINMEPPHPRARIPTFVIGVAVGLILMIVLPFLLTAVYLYCSDIWKYMIRDFQGYREWNRLRKEWNRVTAIDRRRRHQFVLRLNKAIKGRVVSEEDLFRYSGLVRNLPVHIKYRMV
jgi:hypothetical protein